MTIKNQEDFAAGMMFMVVGAGFGYGAGYYSIGTAARMDAGFFPRTLGLLLVVVGVVIATRACIGSEQEDRRLRKWALKPLFFIISANLLFGVLLNGLPQIGLPPMGLLVAVSVLTIVASLAGSEFRLRESLVLAVVLAVGSYLLFVRALNLPLQVTPAFITG